MTVSRKARRRSTPNSVAATQPLLTTRTLVLLILAAAAGVAAVLYPTWGQALPAGLTVLLAMHAITGK